jgi:hypothetical protein
LWSDVSSQYSGLFFRVLGGNSSSFNVVQEENSPRLTAVNFEENTNKIFGYINVIANGELSDCVFTGWSSSYTDYKYNTLRFRVSSEEVRPRNQAIRIWKRV